MKLTVEISGTGSGRELATPRTVKVTERTREVVRQTVFDARKAMGLTSTFQAIRRKAQATTKSR